MQNSQISGRELQVSMWDRLVAKYSPKTAPLLLKAKKNFANSQLESVETNPGEWMTELESLRNEIDKTSISTKMSDEDFMIHVLNNLTEEYGCLRQAEWTIRQNSRTNCKARIWPPH